MGVDQRSGKIRWQQDDGNDSLMDYIRKLRFHVSRDICIYHWYVLEPVVKVPIDLSGTKMYVIYALYYYVVHRYIYNYIYNLQK